MCCGDPSGLLFGIFLVIGTTWWYFIGRIGWESKQGRIGRVTAGLAALLALLFALVGTVGCSTGTSKIGRHRPQLVFNMCVLEYFAWGHS
jgi:hypothetical protein